MKKFGRTYQLTIELNPKTHDSVVVQPPLTLALSVVRNTLASANTAGTDVLPEVVSALTWYRIQMVLMSPPRVRGTGSLHTSSRFTTEGSGNTDRSSPGYPPGWLLTYHV